MKKRIWELDALRGLCIVGMVIVHFFYDLRIFAGIDLALPEWFVFVRQYGHVLFILISGICVTLGSKSVKRGIYVLCAALLISYVTMFMDEILQMGSFRIWFGILHLLGLCMLLYPLFKKFPFWALGLIGIGFIALGFWMEGIRVDVDYLFPIGLRSGRVYTGSDYFPLFPGFGWFLLGAALGKLLYRKKETRLPTWNENIGILRFLRFCGKHSLEIYMLHQPILAGITLLFA